jgi:hypothetical protein
MVMEGSGKRSERYFGELQEGFQEALRKGFEGSYRMGLESVFEIPGSWNFGLRKEGFWDLE